MLGDTVEAALDKMMMTNQHQHSNGLLQEFYVMTQRANEPIGKYAMHLDLTASKVRLQSREALGSNEEEWGKAIDQSPPPKHEPKTQRSGGSYC